MTIDKKILEDPLKAFDLLSEKVYSDTHSASPEFIRKMRKVIEETHDKTIRYTILSGYLSLLESDTYIAADLGRMQIVCEVYTYIKNNVQLSTVHSRKYRC